MPAEAETEKQLWTSILNDVTAHTRTRHLPKRHVVVLGDEGSGKSSLIARLQGKPYNPEDHPLGTGLEYTYIDVKDEETEDVIGRLGVYTLDGNEQHKGLLQFVCNEEQLENTLFLICLDYSKPWNLLSSLERWVDVMSNYLSQFEGSETMDKLKADLKLYFQKFTEPGESNEEGRDDDDDDDDTLLPLEEHVLTVNFGVPVVVVLTKCDAMPTLRKDHDLQGQHFDFIQMKIREFCMTYGAAVVYTGRDGTNKDRLYRYLLHRAYQFPLKDPADITKPETTFIPSAWRRSACCEVIRAPIQQKRLIPFLSHFACFNSPSFSSVVSDDHFRQFKEEVVEVQDEQEFLKQQQARLGRATNLVDGLTRRESLRVSRGSMSRASGGKLGGVSSLLGASSTSAASSSPAGNGAGQQPVPTTTASSSSTTTTTPVATTASSTAATGAADRRAGSTSPTKAPATPSKGGDASQNDVLANFFNSLLQQKSATPQRGDAAAALSR
ncbi:hypothetical protein PTSG_03659 [Salpingoeca rosetta]|uniref:Dynein light intermediate chain n=1 Tax=Salpingoeca rosetta (strain ATCC 50818 / BSB-021) TaxID=946362 RepID=F2U682_SALR5|nr:uncharacterized protein PTSG_03659 [Salpingoeca rosetta]EGD83023.1 hypothetical protein PTSG_03659 [Salpingoeca rosetta]|eukprot:XP_004995387.1 hypothetical protein PTSG_03659 [Salpingoeca rosetta]